MRKRKFWLVFGVTCAAMGLTASSAFAATDPAGKGPLGAAAPSGGTVIFGADQEPRTLNTFTNEGNAAWGSYVTTPVVTTAHKYNNRGVLFFDLLESVTLNSKSPQVVTYKIKQAAKWSDGKPVSADDMIFTYQTIMNPKWSIVSRVGFEDIGSIRKVNAKTIRVTFKKPFVSYRVLWGKFLPAHLQNTELGSNFDQAWRSDQPVANGPFRFVSWSRGSQMVIQKNPNYWGKQALLNQIVFRFIPDTNTQFQAMRGGEVNIIHPQPQQQIADIKGQRGITVQQGSQFSWEHMDLQTGPGGHPALKRKFVRQAIVTAVNRLQMRQVLYKDIAPNLPALNNTIYKNFQPEYEAHKFQPFGFSQKKAIQLLRSNGCTGGPATPSSRNNDIYSCPGVGRLEFDFYSTSGNQQRELAFQIMQAQLKSVGIQLNSKFSLTALTVTLPTKKWDIMLFAWVGTPEPVGSVNIWRCGGAQNYLGYCSRPASRLLLQSNEEFDPKKRAELFNKADELIASHVVTLPLYARPTFLIHDSRLKGALLNPTQFGPTWNSGDWSFAR